MGVDVGHDGLQATDESREARLFFLLLRGEGSRGGGEIVEGAMGLLQARGERPEHGGGYAAVEGGAQAEALFVVAGVEGALEIAAEGGAGLGGGKAHAGSVEVDGAEEVLLNGGRDGTGLGNVAEVDVGNALEEGVALHDLVVEMRKGEGRGGIDDEGEPEAEAGDVDGAALDVNTVDVVANDVALEVRQAKSRRSRPMGKAPEPMAGSQILTSARARSTFSASGAGSCSTLCDSTRARRVWVSTSGRVATRWARRASRHM